MKEESQSMELFDDSITSSDESTEFESPEKSTLFSQFICQGQKRDQSMARLSIRVDGQSDSSIANKKPDFHVSIDPWNPIKMSKEKALQAATRARERIAKQKLTGETVPSGPLKPLPSKTECGPLMNPEKASFLIGHKRGPYTFAYTHHRRSVRVSGSHYAVMSPLVSNAASCLFIFLSLLLADPTYAKDLHVTTFRSLNLYPESFKWDPAAQHFVVGSYRLGSLHSVSDAGVVETLINDPQLPPDVSVGGIAMDSPRGRLLAVIHATDPFPSFDALVAYDLRTRHRLFLARLPDDISDRTVANDVAVDPLGNAFVTNSAGNFIWKVDPDGNPSIFSASPVFFGHTSREELAPNCSLNGIVYARNGYLLAVQSNTGKVYKVDSSDGTARLVLILKDLVGADGIAVRRDGAVVVVSRHTAWLLKSDSAWAEAVVYDELALDVDKFSTAVAVRGDRVYALYGHLGEVLQGKAGREEFSIEEIEWEKESQGEAVWAFVLIGFGMIYFLYWRFQMGQLVKSMNKKRE